MAPQEGREKGGRGAPLNHSSQQGTVDVFSEGRKGGFKKGKEI